MMEVSRQFLGPLRRNCLNQSFCGWLQGSSVLTLEACMLKFKSVLASSNRNITMTELMASLVKETRVVVSRMAPDAFAKYVRRLRRRTHRDRHKLKKYHKRPSEKLHRHSSKSFSVTHEKVAKPWKRVKRLQDRYIELFGSDSESALPEPEPALISPTEPEPIFQISDNGTHTDTGVKRKQPEIKPLRSKLQFMENSSDDDDDDVQFMGTIYVTNNNIPEVKKDKEHASNNNNSPDIKENEENNRQCVYERPCPKSKKRNMVILGNRKKIERNINEEEETPRSPRTWNVKSTEATKVTLQIKSPGHIESRQLENDKHPMQNVVKVNNQSIYNAPTLTTSVQDVKATDKSIHNTHTLTTFVQDEKDENIHKEESVNIKCSDNNVDAPTTCDPVVVTSEYIIKSEIIEIDGVAVNENEFLSNYNQTVLENSATKNLFVTPNTQVKNQYDNEYKATEDSNENLPKLTLKPIESLLNQETFANELQNAYEQVGLNISDGQEHNETPNLLYRKSPNSCNDIVCNKLKVAGTNLIPTNRETENSNDFVQSLAEYILCLMREREKYRKSLEEAEKYTNKDVVLRMKLSAHIHLQENESFIFKKALPYFNPKSMSFFNNIACTENLNKVTRQLANKNKIIQNFNQNLYTEILLQMVNKAQEYSEILGSDNVQIKSLFANTTLSTDQNQLTEVSMQSKAKNTQIPGSDNRQIKSLSKISTPNNAKINNETYNQNLVTTNSTIEIDNLDMLNRLFGLQTSTNKSVLNTASQYNAHSAIVTNPQYLSANSKQTQISRQYITSEIDNLHRNSLPNSSAQPAPSSKKSRKKSKTHCDNNVPSYNYIENSMALGNINPEQNNNSPVDYSTDRSMQHFQNRNTLLLQQLLNPCTLTNQPSPTNQVTTRKESTNHHTSSMPDSLQNPHLTYELKNRNNQTAVFPQNVGTADSQTGSSNYQTSRISSTYSTGNVSVNNMVRKHPSSSIYQNPAASGEDPKAARQHHFVSNIPRNNSAPSTWNATISNSDNNEHQRVMNNEQNYQKSLNRSYQNQENSTYATGSLARDPWSGRGSNLLWPPATSAPIQQESVRLPTVGAPAPPVNMQQEHWMMAAASMPMGRHREWLTAAAAPMQEQRQWPTVAVAPIQQQMQWPAAAVPMQEQRQWPTAAATPMQEQRQWPGQQDQVRSASRDSGFMSPTAAGTVITSPIDSRRTLPELIFCNCRKGICKNCKCARARLDCTDLCKCGGHPMGKKL